MRNDLLREPRKSEEIDFQLIPCIIQGDGLYGTEVTEAGVVD